MCDLDMRAVFEPFFATEKHWNFSQILPPQVSESIAQLSLVFIPNFAQNSMFIRCSKNLSLIFQTRRKNTHVLSAP